MNSPTQLLTDKEGSLEECVRPNWTYMDAFRRVSSRSLELPSDGEISELLSVLLTFGHTSENLLGLLRMLQPSKRCKKNHLRDERRSPPVWNDECPTEKHSVK